MTSQLMVDEIDVSRCDSAPWSTIISLHVLMGYCILYPRIQVTICAVKHKKIAFYFFTVVEVLFSHPEEQAWLLSVYSCY